VVVLVRERRGRIEIMMDILDEASGGVNKTGIVYGANLNFNMAKRYLPLLMKRGLIVRFNGETGDMYEITKRGREILKNYKEIKKFV
jgi:predicted transcriptional regulator